MLSKDIREHLEKSSRFYLIETIEDQAALNARLRKEIDCLHEEHQYTVDPGICQAREHELVAIIYEMKKFIEFAFQEGYHNGVQIHHEMDNESQLAKVWKISNTNDKITQIFTKKDRDFK